jgi:hypothetical protein
MRTQLLLVLVVGASSSAAADFVFVEVGADRGIGPYHMTNGFGGGVAAADFDNDGDIDIFVPTAETLPNQLYRNLGNGHFVNIAATVGLDSMHPDRAALWFDYDGDHDLDLIVARDHCDPTCDAATLLRLYRQEPDGTFTEVTASALIAGVVTPIVEMEVGGLAAGDINNDGYLDVMVTYWQGEAILLLNNTTGQFTNISVSSGVAGIRTHWQCVMVDINNDGWLDIFQAIDFTKNILWLNQGNETFVDVAVAAGVDNAMNDMGVAFGDYDNDGDFDIYITNITGFNEHNVLYRNDSTPGTLQFAEVSQALGVDLGYCGWGTTFLDAANSGWLDLAATNGSGGGSWTVDTSLFYQNDGGSPPAFDDLSVEVGIDDTYWGSSLVTFDHDRDGDLDLLQTTAQGDPLRLLSNQSQDAPSGNYLVVKPRMSGPNHRAIGAVVRVAAGGQQFTRLITAGTSFLGQEPAEAFFGLGSATTADSVTVEWPDGAVTTLNNIAANQQVIIGNGPQTVPAASTIGLAMLTVGVIIAAASILRRRWPGT